MVIQEFADEWPVNVRGHHVIDPLHDHTSGLVMIGSGSTDIAQVDPDILLRTDEASAHGSEAAIDRRTGGGMPSLDKDVQGGRGVGSEPRDKIGNALVALAHTTMDLPKQHQRPIIHFKDGARTRTPYNHIFI